jgi:hypothetical protein
MENVKIQIEVPASRYNELKELMDECHLSTEQELFNTAFTLLTWAVEKRRQGRIIASVDEKKKKYQEISMSVLDKIGSEQAEKSPNVMSGHSA